jgi:hypothetical protein
MTLEAVHHVLKPTIGFVSADWDDGNGVVHAASHLNCCMVLMEGSGSGWNGRDRTCDKVVNSGLLYRLSYIPRKFRYSSSNAGREHQQRRGDIRYRTVLQITA